MTNSVDKDPKRLDEALETIDESRRSALRKMVLTAAFAAPVVASFAVDGMLISPAVAQSGNQS